MAGFDPTQVPTFPVEIDWSHPLADGLVCCVIPGVSLRDLAGSTLFNPGTNPTIGGAPRGPSLYYNATTQTAPYAPVTQKLQLQTVSLVWRGAFVGGVTSNFGLLGSATGNPGGVPPAPYNPWEIFSSTYSGGVETFGVIAATNGTNYGNATFNYDLPLGTDISILSAFNITGSNSITAYANGVEQSLTYGSALPGGTYSYTGSEIIYIGGDWREAGAATEQGLIYNRLLGAREGAWLTAEPFAMLRPVRRRTYFVPARTDVTVFGASAKAGAGVLTAAISFRPPGASVATAASPLSGVVSAPIAGADAKANAGNVSFAVQTGVTGTTAQSRAGFLTSEISIAAPSATAHLAASSLLPAVEPHLSGASVAALAQPLSTKNNDVNAGVVGATMTMYASPLSVSIVNVSPAIERLLLWGSPYSEDNNVSNTSGTYTYAPALSEILVEAFERCGMRTSELTQEHYLSGRRTMNLVQSAWSNRGINLWKVDLVKVLMPQGQISYPVDADVINVLDTYLRQFDLGMPVNVPPKFSTVAGSDVVTITAPTSSPFAAGFYISINVPVSVGGIVVGGFYEVQSVIDGTTYTIQAASNATATVNQGGVVPVFSTVAGSQNVTVTFPNHGYLPGQSFTAQIPTTVGGVVIGGPYVVTSVPSSDTFVIGVPYPAGATATGAENGGNTAIAQQSLMSQFTQSSDPYDLLLYPLSRNDYAAIPDKLGQGRPTSYWFDRTNPGTINVWPVPDANGPYQLCYYVFRQMQDAMPANGQQGDMPQRFFEAYTAEVAAHLAMKWAPPERAIALKQYAQAAYAEAQAEDREKVSTYWVPEMSGYFRK